MRLSHTRDMARAGIFRLAFSIVVAAALMPLQAAAAAPHVVQADLTGDINDISEAYISSVVARADSEDAVRLHVADLEAADIYSLLAAVEGRAVPRQHGSLTIHTAGALIEDNPMPFWQVFLGALIDPTIAALLLLLAAYGIITELSSPGAILPGVVGGIAGVLAVVSLANLPVNIAGALMLLFALALFIADLKANTHGILSAGGVLSLVLGLAFLINTGPIGLGVNPIVIALAGLFSFAFFAFFVQRVLAARRRPVAAGAEWLVGAPGEAREAGSPTGLVFVRGALWRATTSGAPIPAGAPVTVVGRKGLELEVAPAESVPAPETAEEKK